ncbi:MAG: aminotransferase class I/II-fold pyridoxal phosphate-dependent enzyme [bacterium]
MTAARASAKEAVDIGRILAASGPSRVSSFAEKIPVSSILKVAGEIREMKARGISILDLTVGDFHPSQFPVPQGLVDRIIDALEHRETNYPPVQGVAELREALAEMTREDLGLDYSPSAFLVAGGARPLLYSGYTTLVDPGETILFPVPSWNNHHYVRLCGAVGVEIRGTPAKNFHPDRSDVEPHLSRARVLALNSPLNPTGTCIGREQLRGICEAIVEENDRRRPRGERPLFVLFDQVYGNLTFGSAEHFTPVGLVPEMAPYTLLIDAVSKGLCGTGLRVGWVAGPPDITAKMAALLGHYGSWAPRAEQIATARFLRDRDALLAHRRWMIRELSARLHALDAGFRAMREAGLPVEHIEPQGAIYLSVRFDLQGRRLAGRVIRDNEDLRQVLLNEAGFAVVPFEAFGGEGHDGWVRLSVGAVGVDEIEAGLARVRTLLGRVE